MFEKLFKIEKKTYTQGDLTKSKEKLLKAEEALNALDLSKDNVDMSLGMKIKKDWEDARSEYNKINRILNPIENQ